MFKKFCWILTLVMLMSSINTLSAIDEVSTTRGKIALIGTDYNLYSHDVSANELTQLTDDAADTRQYQYPTWSTDGRLAYFCCQPTADGFPQSEVYISHDGTATGTLAYENDDARIIIYAAWSPTDCAEDCRELAILTNDLINGGLSIEIFQDSDDPVSDIIATGSPFYYHWDATGTQLVFHRGNSDLDIFNLAENDVSETLEDSSGLFSVPAWSPTDNRILVSLPGSDAQLSHLAILDGDETRILVEDVEGFIAFAWSPDGERIAYRTVDRFGFNQLVIVDATTGEQVMISEGEEVIAFFWSPDSEKVAFLNLQIGTTRQNAEPIGGSLRPVQDDSPTMLVWNVLDVEATTEVSYSAFIPTAEMIYMLNYFDQFAPSHRVWSPDSRSLVFSGLFTDNQPESMVYMLDISDNNNLPTLVTEGVFGVWSFD